jgi:hypothetical protein
MTRRTFSLATLPFLAGTGCVIDTDAGPTLTATKEVEAGKIEALMAEIRIGVGELRISGGASKLLEAEFRYSEKVGQPDVRYDAAGFRGRLTVESREQKGSFGDQKNEWNLKLGPTVPTDLKLNLGVGESHVDLTRIPLHSLEIHIGVGELNLNLAGKYEKDVSVSVRGGVGEATIRLPRNFGVIADAKGGIGSIDVKGLTQRGGRYVNDAYQEGKPALRLDVRGGVGSINLIID